MVWKSRHGSVSRHTPADRETPPDLEDFEESKTFQIPKEHQKNLWKAKYIVTSKEETLPNPKQFEESKID